MARPGAVRTSGQRTPDADSTTILATDRPIGCLTPAQDERLVSAFVSPGAIGEPLRPYGLVTARDDGALGPVEVRPHRHGDLGAVSFRGQDRRSRDGFVDHER